MWPCGVPQGLGRLGPWSSTAACVVGATGYRGGLLARQAACHFGGMHGAVAIFHDKHGYVIIFYNEQVSSPPWNHTDACSTPGVIARGREQGAMREKQYIQVSWGFRLLV